MKTYKQFLIALIPGSFVLGLTGCDLAPDSGSWRGTAAVSDTLHGYSSCSVELNLTHNEETVTVHKIESNCAQVVTTWDAISFDVHGEQLWKDNRVVGRASERGSVSFELNDPYLDNRFPYPARKVIVTWTKVGNDLEFTEDTYFEGRTHRVHAWLKKQSSGGTNGAISWD